ncbi:MAG: hypothetical protein IJW12_05890, partial [Opitutales bacterium]|nr:hypothetical protein [Opitutales bacterium]
SEDKKSAKIENFLMSCRALGRGIEIAFAQKLLCALRERGVETVFAEYLPTTKNAPCRDFLPSLGFVREDTEETRFRLDLQTCGKLEISPAYKFLSHE